MTLDQILYNQIILWPLVLSITILQPVIFFDDPFVQLIFVSQLLVLQKLNIGQTHFEELFGQVFFFSLAEVLQSEVQ